MRFATLTTLALAAGSNTVAGAISISSPNQPRAGEASVQPQRGSRHVAAIAFVPEVQTRDATIRSRMNRHVRTLQRRDDDGDDDDDDDEDDDGNVVVVPGAPAGSDTTTNGVTTGDSNHSGDDEEDDDDDYKKPPKGPNIGGIIGGVVGGVLVAVVCAVLYWFWVRPRRLRTKTESFKKSNPPAGAPAQAKPEEDIESQNSSNGNSHMMTAGIPGAAAGGVAAGAGVGAFAAAAVAPSPYPDEKPPQYTPSPSEPSVQVPSSPSTYYNASTVDNMSQHNEPPTAPPPELVSPITQYGDSDMTLSAPPQMPLAQTSSAPMVPATEAPGSGAVPPAVSGPPPVLYDEHGNVQLGPSTLTVHPADQPNPRF